MIDNPVEVIQPVLLPLSVGNGVATFSMSLVRIKDARYLLAQKGDLSTGDHPLVRISSMCNFGHIWGSEYCDCRWQLEEAKRLINLEGMGLLIFAFDQHGKGVGLENHYRVYQNGQAMGLELVVDAYKALGFPEDGRDYDDVARIIRNLGLRRIRLLTNSPRRVDSLRGAGIEVERIPLEMPLTQYNEEELVAKRVKLGHLLSAVSDARLVSEVA